MFPRGPRFEPLKVPEGPAPNAYYPSQESQLDAYKRGAFLEKTDRFFKDKESDVPGPGTYKPVPNKNSAKPQQSMNERYNLLQKKLEDLERIHHEGKKAHHIELESLKSELSRCQSAIVEKTEKSDKQKKQNDTLDFRIQELKKTVQADQSEIKELKAKLKIAEHERSLLAAKQGDVAETRRTTQLLDSKHRNDMRERDRRIAELEKAIAMEKKKRELSESKLQELRSKGSSDLQAAQNATKEAETQLTKSQRELSEARDKLSSLQDSFAQERENFLARLAHHKTLLSRIAEQYGLLASNTVPLSCYDNLRQLHTTAEIKILRLERKLGNTEEQVSELAHLVRQVNNNNALLMDQLEDAVYQISIYDGMLKDTTESPTPPLLGLRAHIDTLHNQLDQLRQEDNAQHQETQVIEQRLLELLSNYYNLSSQQLLLACTCVDKEFTQVSIRAQQHSQDLASALASHEAIAASLEHIKEERSKLEKEQCGLKTSLTTTQQACASLEDEINTLKEQNQKATFARDAALKKERETIQRMANTVQKGRMAEDALRAEIDRLLTDLADAERYQEAYYSLSEEIGALLARNQLAEEEAERLSKFNAEILGHQNPAQRIAYVDRIRRELAEAKHQIVTLSREQEAAIGLNADLQHELDMYTSVMTSEKPRTHITRVQRIPLSNVTRSLNTSINVMQNVPQIKVVSKHDAPSGDMTLDEIM